MEIIPNLATYYLLPLIEMSKSSFGDAQDFKPGGIKKITERSNFVNCYLTSQDMIAVKTRGVAKVPGDSILNPYYYSDFTIEESKLKYTFILFRANNNIEDLQKFRMGKYSRMSEIAKDRIRKFNDWDGDHPLLQALYRDEKLRKQLEEELDITLSEEDEVRSIPNPANFITLEKRFKTINMGYDVKYCV